VVPDRVVGMAAIPCLVQSVQTAEAVGVEEVFLVRMVTAGQEVQVAVRGAAAPWPEQAERR